MARNREEKFSKITLIWKAPTRKKHMRRSSREKNTGETSMLGT